MVNWEKSDSETKKWTKCIYMLTDSMVESLSAAFWINEFKEVTVLFLFFPYFFPQL